MILAFDTETTGLPFWGRDYDDAAQPRLVQIGCVMVDREWREIISLRLLVQPDGWVIPQEATDIHGITQEMAIRYGIPVKAALIPFIQLAKRCSVIVAYNISFDAWFIKSEIRRLGSDDHGIERPGVRQVDPMKIGATVMPTGKWPKLRELHQELLKWDYPQAHDGLADARACLRCMHALVDRKIIEL